MRAEGRAVITVSLSENLESRPLLGIVIKFAERSLAFLVAIDLDGLCGVSQ